MNGDLMGLLAGLIPGLIALATVLIQNHREKAKDAETVKRIRAEALVQDAVASDTFMTAAEKLAVRYEHELERAEAKAQAQCQALSDRIVGLEREVIRLQALLVEAGLSDQI